MNCGAQAEAKKLGASSSTSRARTSSTPSQQTPIVNAVAAKKPDAVLIAPTDTKALYAPIKQLGGRRHEDRARRHHARPAGHGRSRRSPPTTRPAASAAAEALAKLIGGKGKVFVVNVKPGISTTDAAREGLRGRAPRRLGLDYVGREYSQDKPDKAAAIDQGGARRRTRTSRASSAPTCSRPRAPRAASARRARKVKIVGFDAGPKQVEDLKDGTVQALIAQKPADIGAAGRRAGATTRSTGKPTTKKIGTESTHDHQGQPGQTARTRSTSRAADRRFRGAPPGAPRVSSVESCCSASTWARRRARQRS